MSSENIIELHNVRKVFRIYNRPLDRILQKTLFRHKKLYKEVVALHDISLSIKPGEAIGIIGPNGSGKSTLLEIIADTMNRTSGKIVVNGQVAALLELGAGFNTEFTGRENVYTYAAIMGISQDLISARFDQIVRFSELEDFIDQPVKTYSSGMYVRLAFAVAINLDPDILIVDEALSVGDIRFQRKCFRKFEQLMKSGKTILFVTHSTEQVVKHCDRAIFIDKGRIMLDGEPRQVVNGYLDYLFGVGKIGSMADSKNTIKLQEVMTDVDAKEIKLNLNTDPTVDGCKIRKNFNHTEYRWGDQTAKILDFLVVSEKEEEPHVCTNGAIVDIYMLVYFKKSHNNIIYGLTIKTVDGITVYGSNTELQKHHTKACKEGSYVLINYRFITRLVCGDYFISLGVAKRDEEGRDLSIDRRYDLIHLRVKDKDGAFGVADIDLMITELETEI